MYCIYILYSEKFDRYYIGQTQDVVSRLARHNARLEKSTSPYVPWRLLGFVEKGTRGEAMVLERKLKKRTIMLLKSRRSCSLS
ncbi:MULTISPECIES: GIY-YIG nuclease family protein [Chryseobacterium]|uniref:GIY-YIG nuclease family protein n=1 Tax=Chryseobacterium sp. R2A-55 TaxID=2744445 RepID=UPI001F4749D4|nr:GIY-YIG nuclease family protein [Chryseobacterium sp. R2A-55]